MPHPDPGPMAAPDRREALIAATAALIAEQGPASVRTRDVTARAGVGVGLLNHYFSWSELRAAGLERVLTDALAGVLEPSDSPDGGPDAAIAAVLTGAFDPVHDPIWQVWIEAEDLARTDAALAGVLAEATGRAQAGLAHLIAAGVAQGLWSCPDPAATALRLLALHEGLLGFLMAGAPALDRAEATAHLAQAFALECPRAG